VNGAGGADLIADMTGNGLLQGGDGDDRIFAGIGNSRLEGGIGNDILVGGTGNDTLVGGSGRDLLQGDPAGARVFGNDRLDGGTGDDLLMGGDGADVFVFRAAGGADMVGRFDVNWLDPATTAVTVEDFTPGLDRIEFETGTFASAADVYAATVTVGGSAVITFGSASMTIFGVTEAELSADSFIFGGALA
jgi:Ca2+-binding RTX toxin-like protein